VNAVLVHAPEVDFEIILESEKNQVDFEVDSAIVYLCCHDYTIEHMLLCVSDVQFTERHEIFLP